jgi:hypothetical protein
MEQLNRLAVLKELLEKEEAKMHHGLELDDTLARIQAELAAMERHRFDELHARFEFLQIQLNEEMQNADSIDAFYERTREIQAEMRELADLLEGN